MADMIVNLYAADLTIDEEKLQKAGVCIKRAAAPDRHKVLAFVRENFSEGWVSECETALAAVPANCFVAVKEGEIIGFACYEATGKDYFGPTGVKENQRGGGVGTALLKRSLAAMMEMGYAYAIIGWPATDAIGFYEKFCGAKEIDGWTMQHSIYAHMAAIPPEKPVL